MALCGGAAFTGIAALLGGAAAAATAFSIWGILFGVFLGADWGGRQATKTEEYRQKLIGKRPSPTFYYDDDGEPILDYTRDPKNT